MRTIRLAIVLAFIAALGACSGGGGGSKADATTTSSGDIVIDATPTTKAATHPPDPAVIAAAIGCAGYAPVDTEELYVVEAGKCAIGTDDEVRVLTFNDNGGRDSFVEVAKGFGLSYAIGDRVAVEAKSATVDNLDGKNGLARA